MKKLLLSILIGLLWAANTKAQTQVWQASTVAGTGVADYNGDGGQATNAALHNPGKMCKDNAGNLYVVDARNQRIRKITTGGIISTFASGMTFTNDSTLGVGPGICADASGNIYTAINSADRTKGSLVYKITPAGSKNIFAGQINTSGNSISNQDGQGTLAFFNNVLGMCIDNAGNIYLTDAYGSTVRKITPAGMVSTVISNNIGIPVNICVDNSGNLYVNSLYFDFSGMATVVTKITPSLTITGIDTAVSDFLSGEGAKYLSICCDNVGNVYATYTIGNGDLNNIYIRKCSNSGVKSNILKSASYCDDIDACEPRASFCTGEIIVDAAGIIYLGEGSNNKIRKLQLITPPPPVPSYNLPANMCVGSNASYQPSVTGSQGGFTLVLDSSITMPAPKAICRNKNGVFIVSAADSILFYDFNGNKQPVTYNTLPVFTNISAIAADDANRVYVVTPDPNNTSLATLRRFDNMGNWDTQFGPASYMFNSPSMAISFGPGYLYAVDTLGPYINMVDTTSSGSPSTVTPLPQPSSNQYSFFLPTSIAFGSNGQMYLADPGRKAILYRNASDNNYYVYDSLRGVTNNTSMFIDIDTTVANTVYSNVIFSTKNTSPNYYFNETNNIPGNGNSQLVHVLDSVPLHLRNPAGLVYINKGGTVPISWIANKGGNNVIRFSILGYSITPPLPAGLSYNFLNGKITGTPTTTAPFTTYTIVTTGTAGTGTTTVAFSVVPPGPVTNTVGTTSSNVVNQADGLTVNYFNTSDCSQMLSIQDAPGGTVLGNTIATQTVYPTIATFNADTFVARVTTVSTQEPDSALANITLKFTYQDIQHYNASVAATYTLSNDTTVTKTMQVGILQMHTKNTGSKQPISHSPLTAHWIAAHHDWEITFAVTKFSTFYMGDATKIGAFTCQTTSKDSIVAFDQYLWNAATYTASGVYMDTLINKAGCDSVLTLKLTINVTTGIQAAQSLNAAVKVYPNPSNGVVNIENQNVNSEIQNIRVFNLVGEQVYSVSSPNQKYLLDISNLTKGVYFIQIETKNETATRRILVE